MKAARLLREARRRAHMTQRDLAVASGISQPSIARIERGRTLPRVDTFDRLLQATGQQMSTESRFGADVDGSTIRALLQLTPADRGRAATVAGQNLIALRSQARIVEPTAPDFQPAAVVELLNRHGVRFVLIGGLAAMLRGSPSVTQEICICYARDPGNLNALAAALTEIHAQVRGAPPDLAFRLDGQTLAAADSLTFTTSLGWLDVLGTPAGTRGYMDLAAGADEMEVFDQRFLVASIDDLIRMKRTADRPRDLAELEILGALREEIDAGQS